MPLVMKGKATNALLDAALRHCSVSRTPERFSRNFSIDCRHRELASSYLILWHPSFGLLPEQSREACSPTPAKIFHLHQGNRDRTVCLYSCSTSSLRAAPNLGLSLEQLPRFFLLSLEPLFFFRAFLPAVSLSPKILKLHTLELSVSSAKAAFS